MKTKILSLFSIFLVCFSCSSTIPQSSTIQPPTLNNFQQQEDSSVDTDAYSYLPSTDGGINQLRIINSNGEQITPLREHQRAPYNGVLFNGPATARLEIEFRGMQSQCLIDRRADVERVSAIARRDISILQNTISSNNRTSQILLSGRDAEINLLYRNQQQLNSSNFSVPYLVIGGAGALVLGFGIGIITTTLLTNR